ERDLVVEASEQPVQVRLPKAYAGGLASEFEDLPEAQVLQMTVELTTGDEQVDDLLKSLRTLDEQSRSASHQNTTYRDKQQVGSLNSTAFKMPTKRQNTARDESDRERQRNMTEFFGVDSAPEQPPSPALTTAINNTRRAQGPGQRHHPHDVEAPGQRIYRQVFGRRTSLAVYPHRREGARLLAARLALEECINTEHICVESKSSNEARKACRDHGPGQH
ncbi:unnamed protein product, partial [Fusarium graminearum]